MKKQNCFLRGNAIGNSSLLSVHSFVESIQLVDEEALPGLPHLGVLAVNFLNHCNSHVREAVARLVEVVSCCLVRLLGVHISRCCENLSERDFSVSPTYCSGHLSQDRQ